MLVCTHCGCNHIVATFDDILSMTGTVDLLGEEEVRVLKILHPGQSITQSRLYDLRVESNVPIPQLLAGKELPETMKCPECGKTGELGKAFENKNLCRCGLFAETLDVCVYLDCMVCEDCARRIDTCHECRHQSKCEIPDKWKTTSKKTLGKAKPRRRATRTVGVSSGAFTSGFVGTTTTASTADWLRDLNPEQQAELREFDEEDDD